MMNDAIREMLLQDKSPDEIKEFACRTQGMVTLWDDVIERLKQGQTTIEEVLRIASND